MAATAAGRRPVRFATPAWLGGQRLGGIALLCVSVIAGLLFFSSARETTPVLVAATDLPAGHVLQASDLAVAQVKVEGRLSSIAIPESDLSYVVGHVLSGRVHAGAMLVAPDIAIGSLIGPNEVGITVPVDANAVYSGMRPGDAVAVLATRDSNNANSQTVTLLERIVVYEISREPGRVAVSRSSESGTEDRGVVNVTLVVPRAESERLAHAVVNWEITLAILPPGPAQGSEP